MPKKLDPLESKIWIGALRDGVLADDVPIGGFLITGTEFCQRRKANWIRITDWDALDYLADVYRLRAKEHQEMANPGFGYF